MTSSGERDDDGDEVRAMRSVWLTMRDEEPPTVGVTALLEAARAEAARMKPRASWWRRSLDVMVRPPMLAAATMVVLIGGGLLINHRSSDVEVAAPTLEPTSPAVTAPLEKRARPVVGSQPEHGRGSADDTLEDTPHAKPVHVHHVPEGRKPQAGLQHGVDTVETAHAEPPAPGQPEQNTSNVIARDANKPPDPPSPASAAPGAVDMRGVSTGVLVDQLVKQAIVAAERKDCPTVRATVERIKKLDAGVYKTRVVIQAAVATCLQ